jgi:hypothetical protein
VAVEPVLAAARGATAGEVCIADGLFTVAGPQVFGRRVRRRWLYHHVEGLVTCHGSLWRDALQEPIRQCAGIYKSRIREDCEGPQSQPFDRGGH